jgi:hypothetical protein
LRWAFDRNKNSGRDYDTDRSCLENHAKHLAAPVAADMALPL